MRGPKYEGQKMREHQLSEGEKKTKKTREHQLAEGEASPLLCVPRSLTRVADAGEWGMAGESVTKR